jgi:hypothetical protein
MKKIVTFVAILLIFSSCNLLKEQKAFIYGATLAKSSNVIELLSDQSFEQSRGVLGDTYYAKAGKGDYELVFKSKTGGFYFAKMWNSNVRIFCWWIIFTKFDEQSIFVDHAHV